MMSREQLIKECIKMTCELNGVFPAGVDRMFFENLSIEDLTKEYNWLWDMVNLK